MITLSHVTILLDEQPIVQDVSLTIEQGTIHAIMGPNGSGKSTLASTIMGHPAYKVVGGTITFNGEDLLALPVEKRARLGIFLASQQPPAVPGVEVFTFLREAHRMLTQEDLSLGDFKNKVYEAFDRVQLDHSFVYRNVHEGFSGGEKKRFEIAQLLLFKPRLALLDEIDSGLDIDALKLVGELLLEEKKRNPGLTLIVITHYRRLLEFLPPDAVHILAKGKIRLSGSSDLAYELEDKGYDVLLSD